MSFLSAEWRKLAIVNYVVEPKVLETYLPAGTELDLWEGKCYVSLLGFMFIDTKVLGVRIPFHVNFEEVNLRFYVRRFEGGKWKSGVVFIKVLVPKKAITFVANIFYKEHYQTLRMKHNCVEDDETRSVEYQWEKDGKWQTLTIEAQLKAVEIEANCEAEFITEHYWGYVKVNNNKTNEYEVTHPRWKQYKVINSQIDVDYGLTYGAEFGFLNELKPTSVMLAEGSQITVENKRKLKF